MCYSMYIYILHILIEYIYICYILIAYYSFSSGCKFPEKISKRCTTISLLSSSPIKFPPACDLFHPKFINKLEIVLGEK